MGKGGILGQLVTWVAINEVRAVHAVQERDEEARPLTAAEENRRREAAGERAKKIFGTVAALSENGRFKFKKQTRPKRFHFSPPVFRK